ncbi:MAG: FkbM family methyltransferase [Halioglobus sp.]
MNTPLMDATAIALDIPALDQPVCLYIHGEEDKFVSRQLRESGVWEPYETTLLLDILEPGSVFVDVGANIGYFSILAASVVGEAGKVIAFEPDPANARLLRSSCDLNGLQSMVDVVEAGLATTACAGQLYLSEDNLGDHQIYAGGEVRESLPIVLLNGSEALAPKLDRLDLLKVDTQGSEFEVISGLMPLLSALACPPQIIIELTPYSLREAGASGRQLIELLATLGMAFWIIDHIEHRLVLSSEQELAQWCDNVDRSEGDLGFMNILLRSA